MSSIIITERRIIREPYEGKERRTDKKTFKRINKIKNQELRLIFIEYVRGKSWNDRNQTEFVFIASTVYESVKETIDDMHYTDALVYIRGWIAGLQCKSNDFNYEVDAIMKALHDIAHIRRFIEITTNIS